MGTGEKEWVMHKSLSDMFLLITAGITSGQGSWLKSSKNNRSSRGVIQPQWRYLKAATLYEKMTHVTFYKDEYCPALFLTRPYGPYNSTLQFWPPVPFYGRVNLSQTQWPSCWLGQLNQYSQLCWHCNTTLESFVCYAFSWWWDRRQVWELHRVQLAPLWWFTGCHSGCMLSVPPC